MQTIKISILILFLFIITDSVGQIKRKGNLFFIPRGSMKIEKEGRQITISHEKFWISNKVTNKEYRKFVKDINSNPEDILKWYSLERHAELGFLEEKIKVEIYSEVAKNIIDTSGVITINYENNLLTVSISEYFNNKKFNKFPVVGITSQNAQYYCYWLNRNVKVSPGFRLPSEIEWRMAAKHARKNSITNKQSNSPNISEVSEKELGYFDSNVPEWTFNVINKIVEPATLNDNNKTFSAISAQSLSGEDVKINYYKDSDVNIVGFRVVKSENLENSSSSFLKTIIGIFGFVIIVLVVAFAIWKWRVRQQFRKEEQRRKLRELELTAIRSQMNPHFLFNSLNSVQNLVQQNQGREAHLYLSDFAGLIRKVLRNSEKEEVSLAEELEMTEQYLNLEKLRFDFEFTITVDKEIDAFNTLVPSMLLQPFVENAVIHGLQNKPENRKLKIEVTKEQTHLAVSNRLAHESAGILIAIEDNGIGREEAKNISKTKNGKGSKLIKERLKILQEKQGEKYKLQIIDLKQENQTGTRVEIFIPEEK